MLQRRREKEGKKAGDQVAFEKKKPELHQERRALEELDIALGEAAPRAAWADAQPEKLKELVGKWQAWADRVGVQPWPLKKQ